MGILFYIISTILSLYVGVLFFKTLKLKEVEMTEEELKQYMIKNNMRNKYEIGYKDRYKYTPIGLPLWLLFLIIIWSFIPILNFISVIILVVISMVLIGDSYSNSFEKVFGEPSKLNKFIIIIRFSNKENNS